MIKNLIVSLKVILIALITMSQFFLLITSFLFLPAGLTTNLSSNPFSILKTRNSVKKHDSIQSTEPIGDGIMLQAFYWQAPDNGKWWEMLYEHIPEFASVGFDSLWIPPMSKTQTGDAGTCGYEPYDYYDLGEFDQKGRIRTRYGTRTELENLISEANDKGVAIVADIVINHNVGGVSEYNQFLGDYSYTDFMNIASGKFPRNYTHFYPCEYGTKDNYQFLHFPDLCHKHPYVRDELIKWGKWLRDEIGFDGWRFDVALGIDADMLQDWMDNVGGWGVAEYWGGTYSDLINYLDEANNTFTAFDFPFLWHLRQMCVGNGFYDMRDLRQNGLLWSEKKDQAVTFVKNHDTVRDPFWDIDENVHLAYAYILTHEGYPCVFWQDYFDLNLQPHIKTLMKIRNEYAKGDTTVLYTDNDIYVAQRNGDPGIIVGLNDNPTRWKEAYVDTKWINTTLHDLTGQVSSIKVDSDGKATIIVPPASYVVFSDDEQITTVPPIPNFDNLTVPSRIDSGIITLDGLLDESWGTPTFADKLGDAGLNQRDLTNLYLKHDNTTIYIGFGYGEKIWKEGAVHYGISIDVKDGGSRDDPWNHQKIKWAGNNVPDYVYYLETTGDYESWGDIYQGKKYVYNSTTGWDSGTNLDLSDFATNPMLGFTELQIPLSDIDFSSGGNISMMVFSSVEGKLGAVDSIPNDKYTDGFGDIDSWLTLPDPLNLTIKIEDFQSTSTTSKTTSLRNIVVVFSIIVISLIASKKRRRYS